MRAAKIISRGERLEVRQKGRAGRKKDGKRRVLKEKRAVKKGQKGEDGRKKGR